MPKNWNRRFKHNRDKMKTGDIFELAEVVRNLSLRDHEKGLSTGEKQMFVKAKKILASELMYAKELDEDEAAEWLEDVLAGVGSKSKRQARRPRRQQRPSARRRRSDVSVWAVLVAAGRGERLGLDRPKAFAPLGGRPLLAESLGRLDASELGRRRRDRGARRLGGAGDPARGGARRRQGRRRWSPAARRAPSRCATALAEVSGRRRRRARPRRGAAARWPRT